MSETPADKPARKDRRGARPGSGTIVPPTGGLIGQAPFVATDEQRVQVLEFVAVGLVQKQICQLVKHPDGRPISEDTLQRHFKEELAIGGLMAMANVGGAIYRGAMAGNASLARLYWNINAHRFNLGNEQVDHNHTIKHFDLSGLTPEQRKLLLPVIDQLLAEAEKAPDAAADDTADTAE